jgi:hypothetical protein
MVGVREARREHERAHKAQRIYGVFPHSSGVENGYVVREGSTRDDGSYSFPSPYGDMTPVATSKSQKLAQKKADSLNGFS